MLKATVSIWNIKEIYSIEFPEIQLEVISAQPSSPGDTSG